MLAKKALSAAPAAVATYVEDIFSTYVYSGQSSGTITIDNGIDLAGEGGLVWIKQRNGTAGHQLCDTERGITNRLQTNTTGAQSSEAFLGSVTSTGFTLPANYGDVSGSTGTYASWTFRKAEKFFDVVTYTGTGSARTVSHNLGSTPGVIIVKKTSSTSDWVVYHRSVGATAALKLNQTYASDTDASYWNNTEPTSSVFTVKSDDGTNLNGATYVAYLFAHDAGGFGDDSDQSVIKCGSFTTGSSWGMAGVDLGWEPQFVLMKRTNAVGAWLMLDNMRGMPNSGGNTWSDSGTSYSLYSTSDDAQLLANSSNAEELQGLIAPTSTGFIAPLGLASSTYIYIAIRRGPMKTPESGTSVFSPVAATGSTGTSRTINFPADLVIGSTRTGGDQNKIVEDRLRGFANSNAIGAARQLVTNTTGSESTSSYPTVYNVWNTTRLDGQYHNGLSSIWWHFRRSPGFFDAVCYTGTGSATTVTHNLGVAPELIIVKPRDQTLGWPVWNSTIYAANADNIMYLNETGGQQQVGTMWNSSSPTSTSFPVGTNARTNGLEKTFVAYLFATLAGVSKVGTYTGNGSSQTINCGFASGARFVLIKRTDSTGDWVVFDSARGIISGNDPYLELNTTDAEVTDKDAVDTDSTGFVVNETTGPNINTNSATYIYLAIA